MLSAALPEELSSQQRKSLATLGVGATFGLLLDHLSSGQKRRTADALEQFAGEFTAMVERGKGKADR
jgi:hypothetical protein